MRLVIVCVLFIAVAGGALAPDAAATPKKRIGVRMQTDAVPVAQRYGNRMPDLNRAVRDSAVLIFNRKLPFVVFEPDAGHAVRVDLEFAFLDRTATSLIHSDLGLHFTLHDPTGATTAPFQIVRSKALDGLPPSWEVFAAEIAQRIAQWSSDALVERALSRVSIADSALCWSTPLGVVLPFTHAELCLGLGTTLEVDAEVDEGAGPQPLRLGVRSGNPFRPGETLEVGHYRDCIFSAVQDSSGSLSAMRSDPRKLTIRRISMRKFLLHDQCGLVAADGGGPR